MGKITGYAALTTLSTDDLLYVVNAPGTTPASKKVTFDNLQKSITELSIPTVTVPTAGFHLNTRYSGGNDFLAIGYNHINADVNDFSYEPTEWQNFIEFTSNDPEEGNLMQVYLEFDSPSSPGPCKVFHPFISNIDRDTERIVDTVIDGDTVAIRNGQYNGGASHNMYAKFEATTVSLYTVASFADLHALLGTPTFQAANSDYPLFISLGKTNIAACPPLAFAKTRGNDPTVFTTVQDADEILRLQGLGANGTTYRNVGDLLLMVEGTPAGNSVPGAWVFRTVTEGETILTEKFRIGDDGLVTVKGNIYPATDNTTYLGKNDDDTPLAFKGVILKDTTNGKYYRVEVINGTVTATDLTD